MLNKCCFIGNVGRLPEVTYTQSGVAIAKFSVGCSEKWTDKNSGEKKEHTEWIRFVAFGKQAEAIGRYVTVGQQLYVESKTKTSKYEKNGEDRYSTEFQVTDFKFLGKKQSSQQQNTGGFNGHGNFQGHPQQGFQQNQQTPQQQNNNSGFQNQGMMNQEPQQSFQGPPDDDIPF